MNCISSTRGGPYLITDREPSNQVIEETFLPTTCDAGLPPQLVPDLLRRFSSGDGYELFPDVKPLFEWLAQMKTDSNKKIWQEVLVGIISNSDDRVPNILSSLGLKVDTHRFVSTSERTPRPQQEHGSSDIRNSPPHSVPSSLI